MKRFNWRKFSTDLKKFRYDHRDSLRVVARESNVSASTISRIENGKKIEIDHILRLCDYMNNDLHFYVVDLEKAYVEPIKEIQITI